MNVQLLRREAEAASGPLDPGALRQRALPLLSRRHTLQRRDARTFEAQGDAGATAVLSVSAEGTLFELLAPPETDSAFLAAAWRAARQLPGVHSVEVRTDDPLLLPLALHESCPDEVSVVARWYFPGSCAPLTPELRERSEAFGEVSSEGPREAVLERAAALQRDGRIPVLEVAETSPGLQAALLAAGFQESVLVLRRRLASPRAASC